MGVSHQPGPPRKSFTLRTRIGFRIKKMLRSPTLRWILRLTLNLRIKPDGPPPLLSGHIYRELHRFSTGECHYQAHSTITTDPPCSYIFPSWGLQGQIWCEEVEEVMENKMANSRVGGWLKFYLMTLLGTFILPIIKTSTYYTFLEILELGYNEIISNMFHNCFNDFFITSVNIELLKTKIFHVTYSLYVEGVKC